MSCPVGNNTGLVGCGLVGVLERPRVEQTEVDDEDDYDRDGDYDGDAEHDENPEVLAHAVSELVGLVGGRVAHWQVGLLR